jgi:hypothetical protein
MRECWAIPTRQDRDRSSTFNYAGNRFGHLWGKVYEKPKGKMRFKHNDGC